MAKAHEATTQLDIPRSRDERSAEGRARRKEVPLAGHADIGGGTDRDPIAVLHAQDAARVQELVPIRWGRMSASPFAFYRGAAALMATDLSFAERSNIDVQLCGDAHVSNFGIFSAPDRRLVFDVNDFDETATGPFEFDVKRLAASVAVAGEDNGLSAKKVRKAVRSAVDGYRAGIAAMARIDPLGTWYFRVEVDALVDLARKQKQKDSAKELTAARKKATKKNSLGALNKLTETVDGRRQIKNNPPLIRRLAPEDLDAELQRQRRFFKAYVASLPHDRRALLDRYVLTDVAFKVVGVGSVGTRCLIALLETGDSEPLFLQLKEAVHSVLEPYLEHKVRGQHGRRVVDGEQLIQSATDEFLGWSQYEAADGSKNDYYVRQLWDGKASLDIATMNAKVLVAYAQLCGVALARAHARSGDAAAINGYIGDPSDATDTAFEDAIVSFAVAYAERNREDHAAVVAAIKDGKLEVVRDL